MNAFKRAYFSCSGIMEILCELNDSQGVAYG